MIVNLLYKSKNRARYICDSFKALSHDYVALDVDVTSSNARLGSHGDEVRLNISQYIHIRYERNMLLKRKIHCFTYHFGRFEDTDEKQQIHSN